MLSWEGVDVVAVRLPQLADSLDHILADLERTHGMPLADLDRKTKQSVVRMLEARGAFSVRHGVETVASALGVSRFTVYNYLNREHASAGAESRMRGVATATSPNFQQSVDVVVAEGVSCAQSVQRTARRLPGRASPGLARFNSAGRRRGARRAARGVRQPAWGRALLAGARTPPRTTARRRRGRHGRG